MNTTKPLTFFSQVLLANARQENALINGALSTNTPMYQLSLPEYVAAIREFGIDKLFDEKLLSAALFALEQQKDSLVLVLPPGSQVLVVAMPTDSNGTPYTVADVTACQSLKLVIADPASHKSLLGETWPTLLPVEVWGKCSFNFWYEPHGPAIADADLIQLKQQIMKVWQNLRQLVQS